MPRARPWDASRGHEDHHGARAAGRSSRARKSSARDATAPVAPDLPLEEAALRLRRALRIPSSISRVFLAAYAPFRAEGAGVGAALLVVAQARLQRPVGLCVGLPRPPVVWPTVRPRGGAPRYGFSQAPGGSSSELACPEHHDLSAPPVAGRSRAAPGPEHC